MAAIPGSVAVTGFIAPTDSTDTFPAIDPVWGIDGYRSVADHTERNAIPDERRRYGMLVFTQNDGKTWLLEIGPWAGDDTDWTEDTGGGGGSPVGPDGSIQSNQSGSFFGDEGLTYFQLSTSSAYDAYVVLQGGMEIDDELFIDGSINGSIYNDGILTQNGTSTFTAEATFTGGLVASGGAAVGNSASAVDANLALFISETRASGSFGGIYVEAINNSAGSTTGSVAIEALAQSGAGENLSLLTALKGDVVAASTGGHTVSNVAAFKGTFDIESAVSNLYGVWLFQPDIIGATVGNFTGVSVEGPAINAGGLGDFRGLYISSPTTSSGGTLTHAYGIIIEDMVSGSPGAAIQTGKGFVSFGDTTYINLTTNSNRYGLQVGLTTTGLDNQAFGIESSILTIGTSTSFGGAEHTAMRLLAGIGANSAASQIFNIDIRQVSISSAAAVGSIYGARIDIGTGTLPSGATLGTAVAIDIKSLNRATNNFAIRTGTSGRLAFGAAVETPSYTISGLPTGVHTGRAVVVNAGANTFAGLLGTSTGTNVVPVYFDGTATAWRIG